MMRLSTMWSVDATIDAEGRSPVADRILERWEYDRDSSRFFRSCANFVYSLRRGGGACFLRFAAGTEREWQAIEAEVELVGWLRREGLGVPEVLPSRVGDGVETVETDSGAYHAVVMSGLAGEQREIEELDTAGFRSWGAALGELHAALARAPRSLATARPSWREHLAPVRHHLPPDATPVRTELESVEAALGALPRERDAYGAIHGDFELDNLFWSDGVVSGIVDLDDCSRGWYAADVAFALRDLWAVSPVPEHPSFRAFISGYGERFAMDQALLLQLPLFGRLSDLVTYGRIARALDLPRDPAHPEWVLSLDRKPRERMHRYEVALTTRA